MEIIGYLLAIFMGVTLGLIGAGGSIMTVPILVYFLGVSPVIATGYSLLLVGTTALIGGIHYYRKQQVDIRTSIIFATPAVIAVYITRAWLVPAIPDPFFSIDTFIVTKDIFIMLLFAALMLIAGILMIRGGTSLKPHKEVSPLRRAMLIGTEGAVVGIFTGVVGAGGGFLIIPALVLLAGMEMKIAVGSSLFIIACKSLFGFTGDLQTGITLDYTLLSLFLTCTITGMLAGTMLSKHVTGERLKKAFGWFTLLVGTIMIFKELQL